MVKCKYCPRSEFSLKAGAFNVTKKDTPNRNKLYCRLFDKHVDGHFKRWCNEGDVAIKKKGSRDLTLPRVKTSQA